ncbi:alpha/beta fold hydrolase [Agromyces sp. NPDC127015]|uniref:alpha/beta fold hydrolase n=1 Tax=Agromyces sp. NPDC127015 TaxID=3347108 RepID=UPI003660E7D2
MTEFVTSADGTRIAYDRAGYGPPVILVGGAMQYRAFDQTTVEMAAALAAHGFDVVNFDRRGRGESPAAPPITLAQTVDDLRAITDELRRDAIADDVALFGNSSGGAIALAAAAAGLPVSKLVLFEVPLDEELGGQGDEFLAGLRERIAAGDPAAVIEHYMADMPPEWLAAAKQSPAWPLMLELGPSLEPDAESLAWSQSAPRAELWRGVTAPTLALVGEETLPIMTAAAASIVASMPNAESRSMPAVNHAWEPSTMALAIAGFLVG